MSDTERWRDHDPQTMGQLYDMLRWAFGLGSWSEWSETPYFRARGVEMGKLKASMTRRRLSIPEAVTTARYCQRHHMPVLNVTQLFKHVSAAKAEARELRGDQMQLEVDSAIACERSLADEKSSRWIELLSRAQGPYRGEVLDEWRHSRQLTTTAATA